MCINENIRVYYNGEEKKSNIGSDVLHRCRIIADLNAINESTELTPEQREMNYCLRESCLSGNGNAEHYLLRKDDMKNVEKMELYINGDKSIGRKLTPEQRVIANNIIKNPSVKYE